MIALQMLEDVPELVKFYHRARAKMGLPCGKKWSQWRDPELTAPGALWHYCGLPSGHAGKCVCKRCGEIEGEGTQVREVPMIHERECP